MDRNDVLQAIDYCMMQETAEFTPCDSCPMMEAGCDEGFTEFVRIPRCLLDEIIANLNESRSEWSHVAYVRTKPREPIQ